MLSDEDSKIFALSFLLFFFGACVCVSFLVEYMDIRREFLSGSPRVAPVEAVEVSVDTEDPVPETHRPAFQSNTGDVVHIVRGGNVYYIRSSSVYVLPHLNPSNATNLEAALENATDTEAAFYTRTGDAEEAAFFQPREPSGPADPESPHGFETSVYIIPLVFPADSISLEAVLSGGLEAEAEASDPPPVPLQLRKAGSQRFVPVADPVPPPRSTTRWSRAGLEFRLGNYSMGPCFICCEAQATVVVLHCGHGGMCLKCARKLWSKEHKCPICRGDYVDMAHILAVSDEGVASALSCTV